MNMELNKIEELLEKYFEGTIPFKPEVLDPEFLSLSQEVVADYKSHMDRLEFGAALQAVFRLIGRGNKFIEEEAPWNLVKEGNTARLQCVMYQLVEILRLSTIMLSPVLVESAAKVREQLGLSAEWFAAESLSFGALYGAHQVAKGPALFPRIDLASLALPEEGEPAAEKPKKEKQAKEKTENKEQDKAEGLIGIEDFAKVQLKVGRILEARKVEKADKLLQLSVKVGPEEVRTIVAGIASAYAPESLPGKLVVVAYNLKPAKLRGILSQGMLLAAKGEDGSLRLLTPDGELEEGAAIS